MPLTPIIELDELFSQAGQATYQKGVLLFKTKKVSHLQRQGDVITATVQGSEFYQVKIILKPELRCECTCPAAEYMDVCKHAVAVGISLCSSQINDETPAEKENSDEQRLLGYFNERSKEELITFFMQQLERDETLRNQWLMKATLAQKNTSLEELKKLVAKALPEDALYSWQEVKHYFQLAEPQLDNLWQAMTQLSVEEQWRLTLHILKRLNDVLAQIDDSGGFRFEIEGQIYQNMAELFEQLSWSTEAKAKWLFDHMDQRKYDIFPDVLEHFKIHGEVETCLLLRCREALERIEKSSPSDNDRRWRIRVYAEPLLTAARANGNWREEERLLAMQATSSRDYLSLAQLCLDHHEELDAEDWLRKAKKNATEYELHECTRQEIRIRIALGENVQAWRLGWQLFEETHTFRDYKALLALHDELGKPEPDLLKKVEQVFANPQNQWQSDAQIEFYLSINDLIKAKQCAANGKITYPLLLRLAEMLIVNEPSESLSLYVRVIRKKLEYSDNRVYDEVIKLLQRLQKQLQTHNHSLEAFAGAVSELAKEFRRKRNLLALFNQHFPQYL